MKRLLNILLTLLALVVVLVLAAAIIIPLVVDPNDFKGQLSTVVHDKTGRNLDIQGDLDLSVFPWLGVEVGRVSLSNPDGFGGKEFAGAERMDVRVKLVPLLQKRIEMRTVSLHGLNVNLVRRKDGHTNWEDLAGAKGKQPAEKPVGGEPRDTGGMPPLAALAIGGVNIQDASIHWLDQQAGKQFTVDRLNLETGTISPGRPIDLDLKMHVQAKAPALDTDLAMSGVADLDLEGRRYQLRQLRLKVVARGADLPVTPLEADLKADIDADLSKDLLTLTGLRLDALGLALNGDANVQKLANSPEITANLSIPEVNPRKLMERLGREAPNTRDPEVLRRVSLTAKLTGSPDKLKLVPLKITLDDTHVEGRFTIKEPQVPKIRFDLTADAIDLDRYLPPPPTTPENAPPPVASPGTAAAGAGEVRLEGLRGLDMSGRFTLGQLKVKNLKMSDISLTVNAQNGVLKVDPIAAQLYGGTYDGHIHLDARGKEPVLSTNEKLTAVQAEPLLADLVGTEKKYQLAGTAQFSARINTHLGTPETTKRNLNGELGFSFLDGAVKGINIGQMIRVAKARLRREPVPQEEGPDQTDFTELRGTVQIRNGVADNRDLYAKSPLLRVEGRGTADLVQEQLDYLLKAVIVSTAKGQGGKDLEDLKGLPVPIKITGPFQKPSIKLSLQEVLKDKSTQVVKEKLQEKLQEKAGKEQLREKIGGKLKGLLNR